MILHTGLRTDIPAFYSDWLLRRFAEGHVLVRNPYNHRVITKYRLSPDVVDLVCFCTKNPEPMLRRLDALSAYRQFWFVTITPYGPDIEPQVPPADRVISCLCRLSDRLGPRCVAWRYDPILLTDRCTEQWHIDSFARMARALRGATDTCVISFVDLYLKVQRNFPECREVPTDARLRLGSALVQIARENGMVCKTCAEGDLLAPCGADTRGCMTLETYERAIGARLNVPHRASGRKECACYLSADIGAYDTCGHLCRYCYANSDPAAVQCNRAAYDPASPLLCGQLGAQDEIREARQESWLDGQLRMEL